MKIRVLIFVIASIFGITMTGIYYIHPPVHFRQLILLLLYILLHFWLVWRNKELRWAPTRIGSCVLLAFAWLYSSHHHAIRHMSFFQGVIFCLAGLGISFSFYLLTEELKRPFKNPTRQVSPWWMVLYGIVPILGWTPYFLAYYPAKMNADSFWQWAMAHRVTPYNDWHPVLHTWMIQATMGIYNSPASYIILQILIMALVISYALFSFQKLGLPLWLALVIDVFYALNPVNGFLAITMWKDIPFSASILLLTVLLIKIASDHDWLKKRSHVIGFVIVCFFASNLRSNGFEVVFASLLITVALLKEVRRRLLFLMVPILILQFIFIVPVMGYFNVIKPPLNEALAIPSQQIAATYKYHGKFRPQLRSYFDQILPAKKWRKDYIPYNVNPIKWDRHYNAEVITANFPHYLSSWARLMMLNPKIFARAYMKQIAVIWQFTTPKGIKPYLVTPINLQQYPAYVKMRAPKDSIHLPYNKMVKASYRSYNHFLRSHGRKALTYAEYQTRLKQTFEPLKTKPASKHLRKTMDKLLNHTRFNWKNYFVKGAIPLFFMLLSLVAAISRYKRRGWMVYLPAIFVILTMAMAMPATDFRYSYGFAFSVPFLLIYPKLRNNNREESHGGEAL